jgi:short-subunit dehydrogenase
MNDKPNYAVITGASSGIGWFVAVELAKKGYSIVGVSNQAEALDKLKSALENKYNIHVLTYFCDLARNDAAEMVFNFCQQRNIEVDVLVNNAGILVYGEVIRIDIEKTKNILQLHMHTPAVLCRLFADVMVKKNRGYILNVSSISSVMPFPIISLYGPTKTFIRQFTKALGFEMKGTGVHVSCLLPGATATALYDSEKVDIARAIKLGVMKSPEDVAKAGVEALFKNKAECIPGAINKIIMFIIPLLPNFLIDYIYKKKKSKLVNY